MCWHPLLSLLFTLIVSSSVAQKPFYEKLSSKQFSNMAFDTVSVEIGANKVYLQTGRGRYGLRICGPSNIYPIALEKTVNESKSYYLLNTNVDFLNDSTFIEYTFIPPDDSTSRHFEEGVWIHVRFKRNRPQLDVNKKPAQAEKVPVVNGAGIYHYASGALQKVSSEQSYIALCQLKTDGYYYLPGPGRLYTLHSIHDLR